MISFVFLIQIIKGKSIPNLLIGALNKHVQKWQEMQKEKNNMKRIERERKRR